jgi:3-methyladenine DNA glycosylase/8-oxoguanine DNA glycosylase
VTNSLNRARLSETALRSEYKAQYIGALAEAEIEGDSRPFLDFMTDELCEDLSQEIDAYAAKCKL